MSFKSLAFLLSLSISTSCSNGFPVRVMLSPPESQENTMQVLWWNQCMPVWDFGWLVNPDMFNAACNYQWLNNKKRLRALIQEIPNILRQVSRKTGTETTNLPKSKKIVTTFWYQAGIGTSNVAINESITDALNHLGPPTSFIYSAVIELCDGIKSTDESLNTGLRIV